MYKVRGKKRVKKRQVAWLFLLLAVVLAGCSEINQPITAESKGFWNEYIVYPLSWLITYTSELFGSNYGLGIIVVTILIRLAILPLMIQQTRNSKAMQALQPELQKLRETMLLFQKHGVNPLAGCLPLFIQMPILIGFYHAIMRTEEIARHNFLWFDLGEKDPFFILPLVAGVTTFIQQKIMMAGTEQQNPQMAMMLWLMPIMVVVFAINFPAALSLYWVVGNLFMIAQTYFIKGPDLKATKQAGGTGK